MEKVSIQGGRNKLIEQFNEIIKDDEKTDRLKSVFTDLLDNHYSTLSETQW